MGPAPSAAEPLAYATQRTDSVWLFVVRIVAVSGILLGAAEVILATVPLAVGLHSGSPLRSSPREAAGAALYMTTIVGDLVLIAGSVGCLMLRAGARRLCLVVLWGLAVLLVCHALLFSYTPAVQRFYSQLAWWGGAAFFAGRLAEALRDEIPLVMMLALLHCPGVKALFGQARERQAGRT